MASDRPDRERIFHRALEIEDREARAAYLDEACRDDRQLRTEIEQLLQFDEGKDDLLDFELTAQTSDVRTILEQPGDEIGRFKLLQRIGEGGMGVVYMADQKAPVRRRVALKIIKPGMDSRQVVARFEAERQALAMMDHPNIAKVLDCGTTETGRPYFVMELVKGVPITRYCDENHVTPRERLELFVPVCQAIQHAHQKGIIHRDIKPSNILVAEYDHKAVPKIIDFGVAKALNTQLTDKTMFTQLGQIVGTIEYMSPEQAKVNQLDVDTRSDIYSLGVLLYELLTGATPFDKKRLRTAALDELMRILREEEPPRPSTRLSTIETLPSVAANRKIEPKKLSLLLNGELDWIVMKALEKDRGRRYDTAAAFADDIKNYLNDDAVIACPPSTAYRFKKFARRNKVAIATGSLVAAALIIGIIGTTWQAIRASRQAERALNAEVLAQARFEEEKIARRDADGARQKEAQQRMIADRQRQEAEVARKDAERARDEAKTESERSRTVVNILMDLLTASHIPDELARPQDYTVAQLVWDFSQRIPPQLESQPAIEAEVRSIIGRAMVVYDKHEEAMAQLERAQTVRRNMYGETHPEYAKSLLDFYEFYQKAFMPKKAEEFARSAMAVSQQHPTEIELHLRCIDALANCELPPVKKTIVDDGIAYAQQHGAESNPWAVNLLLQRARTDFLQSKQVPATEQPTALQSSASTARRALEAHQRVYGETHPRTGKCHQLAGEIAEAEGKLAEAEQHYLEAMDLLVANPIYNYPARGHVMQRLRYIYEARNDEPGFQKLLLRYRDAGTPRYFFWEAIQSLDRGDLAKYRAVCRRMASMYVDTENDLPRDYLLWTVFARQDAVDDWVPIVTLARKYSAKHSNNYSKALHGIMLYRAGRYSEALDALKPFTDAIPNDATPEFYNQIRYFSAYPVLFRAMTHYRLGDRDNASRWFARGSHWYHWNLNTDQWGFPTRQRVLTSVIHEEARQLIEPDPDSLKVDLINSYWHIAQAELHRARGDLPATRSRYEKAIELEPESVPIRETLADLLRTSGQYADAIAAFSKAIELAPEECRFYIRRGSLYRAIGQTDQALADFNRAIDIWPHGWSWRARGEFYRQSGDYEKAIADYTRGWDPDNDNHPYWLVKRGECYQQLGRYSEALADYHSALELGIEDHIKVYRSLIDCYKALDQLDQAIGELDKVVKAKPESAAYWHRRGDYLNLLGKHEAAIDDFTKAIQLDPQHVWAHHNRGDCYKALGQFEQAIDDYRTALQLGFANSTSVYQDLVECYRQLGRFDEAIADLNTLVELKPDDANSWHHRGDILNTAGQYQAAIDDYSRALEIDPEHAWARLNRGHCQARLGNKQQAIDDYLATQSLRASDSHFQFTRGERLLQVEQYESALLDLERAIELNPRATHYRKRAAVAHFHLGQFEQALTHLTVRVEADSNDISTIVWINPELVADCPDESFKAGLLSLAGQLIEATENKAQAHVNRAKLHFAFEEDEAGRGELKSAVALEPDNPQLCNQIGLMYGSRGQEDKAREHYSKTIELDPSLWFGWFNRAMANSKLGHTNEAIADFAEAAQRNPTHARIYNQRGILFHRNGQVEKARDDYSRCIELEPNGAVHWANRAVAHRDLSEYDAAVADSSRALEINPNHTNALQWRAQSYRALKRWPEAVDDYSRLVELEPNKPAAFLNRGKAYVAMGENEKAQTDFDRYLQPFNKQVEKSPDDWQALNRRGVAFTNLQRWEQAQADFSRAIELAPEESVLWKNRATSYIERQQWSAAADDLQQAIKLGESGWQARYHLALCRLGADDLDGYRDTCRAMIESFSETTNPLEANFAAWSCCLAPEALDDWDRALKLARLAVNANAESLQHKNTLGTLLLRCGQTDEAIKELLKITEQLDSESPPQNVSPAYTWFALAIAYVQAGQSEEAQQWLNKANLWTDEVLAKEQSEAAEKLAWNRRLTLQLLSVECHRAIGQQSASSDQ